MTHVVADRVLEASTSSGTGPFTLAGAVLGFRAFTGVCAVADTIPYFIEAVDDLGRPTGEFEYGLGTYSAANQLTRTTVRGSSNGGLAVSFGAGTKLVGLGIPAPNSSATRLEWRNSLGFTAVGNAMVTAADAAAARALLGGYREIQSVVVSVNGVNGAPANGMRLTINPTVLDFRSATLGSGAVDTVAINAALNLDVVSGATLGMSNGVKACLAYGVMNNGGVAEPFINNLFGAVNLNEQGLLTTTAMTAASDLANAVYSTTARANLPYRLLGFLEVTLAAAGTWNAAPSIVDGGSSPLAKWLSGYGQSLQVPGNGLNITYTNDGGRPRDVYVCTGAVSLTNVNGQINGTNVVAINADSSLPGQVYLHVLPGQSYRVNTAGSLVSWMENR